MRRFPKPGLPPRAVEIEWRDAAWHDHDGPMGSAPGLITLKSVGYYTDLTKDAVKIHVDWDPETNYFRSTYTFPRVQIVAMRFLDGKRG